MFKQRTLNIKQNFSLLKQNNFYFFGWGKNSFVLYDLEIRLIRRDAFSSSGRMCMYVLASTHRRGMDGWMDGWMDRLSFRSAWNKRRSISTIYTQMKCIIQMPYLFPFTNRQFFFTLFFFFSLRRKKRFCLFIFSLGSIITFLPKKKKKEKRNQEAWAISHTKRRRRRK